MKMIVGLGNVGSEYDKTRHNVGFMVIDSFAKELDVKFKQDNSNRAFVAECCIGVDRFFLVKPTTYMNLSGESIASLINCYNLNIEDILVIHDDMDMRLGQLRVRTKGSSGGHNGIKSIISNLGTDKINRLKFGISHPKYEKQEVINFVLSKFSEDDLMTVYQSVQLSKNIIRDFIKGKSIDKIMNKYN